MKALDYNGMYIACDDRVATRIFVTLWRKIAISIRPARVHLSRAGAVRTLMQCVQYTNLILALLSFSRCTRLLICLHHLTTIIINNFISTCKSFIMTDSFKGLDSVYIYLANSKLSTLSLHQLASTDF